MSIYSISTARAKLFDKTQKLYSDLSVNPFPANSNALLGDLIDKRSIRINIKHRLVYEVLEKEKIIKILSLWEHY